MAHLHFYFFKVVEKKSVIAKYVLASEGIIYDDREVLLRIADGSIKPYAINIGSYGYYKNQYGQRALKRELLSNSTRRNFTLSDKKRVAVIENAFKSFSSDMKEVPPVKHLCPLSYQNGVIKEVAYEDPAKTRSRIYKKYDIFNVEGKFYLIAYRKLLTHAEAKTIPKRKKFEMLLDGDSCIILHCTSIKSNTQVWERMDGTRAPLHDYVSTGFGVKNAVYIQAEDLIKRFRDNFDDLWCERASAEEKHQTETGVQDIIGDIEVEPEGSDTDTKECDVCKRLVEAYHTLITSSNIGNIGKGFITDFLISNNIIKPVIVKGGERV